MEKHKEIMGKVDVYDEPGTLIKTLGNKSFEELFSKLMAVSTRKTIPFFLDVDGVNFMGRAETTAAQDGGYPNYHITIYNPKMEGYKLEPIMKVFVSSNENRIGLEEKLYDLHGKLKEFLENKEQ